jgi:diguanylate cyclase (GGDEF)-like protein
MEIDIFNEEQQILNRAAARIVAVRGGVPFDFEEHVLMVKEYGCLLRQLRRTTRHADRTAVDLNASNMELTDKIQYDTMTGIYNRRYLEENLKRITKSHSRSGGTLSVLMLDVDLFKRYNDRYGHSEGDRCLIAVAEAFAGALSRADDFVVRYGGEEFAVVLPNTDEEGARHIADKLLDAVRSRHILHEDSDVSDRVTVSIGVTTGLVRPGVGGADFIAHADKALYISKQGGRDRYTFMQFEEAQPCSST